MNMGQLVEQGSGEVFPLGFEPVSIGRHADNEIILADPLVSRHHAEIVMQGGRWVISDLGSANGSYVNGQRTAGPQVLNHGDLVRVGQTQFQVEIAAAIADQDTLVEAGPVAVAPPPSAPSAPARSGLVVALVAAAAIIVILLVIFLVWARAASMTHVFFPALARPSLAELATFLAIGSMIGSLFAAFVFCISAFSLPMIVDRKADMVTAVVTSFNAVLRNKAAMLVWALLIVAAVASAGIPRTPATWTWTTCPASQLCPACWRFRSATHSPWMQSAWAWPTRWRPTRGHWGNSP